MAFLRAFGSSLPERIVTNEELAPQLGVSPDWIFSQSGIRQRRYACTDETVATLGHRAAQQCLEKAALKAEDLGMILVASGSADRFCPGPASSIAALLGLSATPALDLPIASAGSLAGLALASRLADGIGNILVLGAEIMSRRIEPTPEGRNTAILFGDGAGACVVSPTEGFAQITDSCLHTDGNSAEALTIQNNRIAMDGSVIIRHATRRMPQAMAELLDRNTMKASEIGTFLLHQANSNFFSRIAQTLKVPVECFFANIQHYGNTSSASMLIAADEWRTANPAPLAAPLMFSAFGVGLNWGAVLALPL
ncbi:3-oxoacyl-[acyl-carrier-protein] synthase-3 [Granulicella pectinivorans]|uniref:3-oxoacyl-[acyl-carrier-protein] synthase-3 n=1 Tax=Granulicella pectinivorans TaxID=474950 RepID=A0A1I6LL22_9BACT|nr:ketoacyl-ACP synthase III [Granulicella pectinivorans]SFS04195.1 3-oxoacyl-[acyl-carrier-protein] synthase-3 [Granulicella pectinivorans]